MPSVCRTRLEHENPETNGITRKSHVRGCGATSPVGVICEPQGSLMATVGPDPLAASRGTQIERVSECDDPTTIDGSRPAVEILRPGPVRAPVSGPRRYDARQQAQCRRRARREAGRARQRGVPLLEEAASVPHHFGSSGLSGASCGAGVGTTSTIFVSGFLCSTSMHTQTLWVS